MSAHNDSAFLRMFLMVLGALVAFTVIILILANTITGSVEEARGPDPRLRAAIAERIKPVGSVNVAAPAAATAEPQSGADIVASACNACHVAGVLDAPKIGDTAAWEARMEAVGGVDGLTASAIQGKGGMPPKGGAMVSDEEIRAAVVHMLTESGVDAGAASPETPAAAPAEPAPGSPAESQSGPVAAAGQMARDAVDAAGSVAAAMMPSPAAPRAEPKPAAAAADPAPAADAPTADLARGKQVYSTACFVCHATGAAGAPKLGDTALWAPRIEQGMKTLNANAINGKGAMPPKGGRMDLSDADVEAAVAYMVSESQ